MSDDKSAKDKDKLSKTIEHNAIDDLDLFHHKRKRTLWHANMRDLRKVVTL